MKKTISYLKFMYFYLKGVIRFRTKDYNTALLFFEKASKNFQEETNELFYQYYGQTLLALEQIDESFYYLSKSYEIYNKKGWKVSDDEEYRLAMNTLDALKYLDDTHNIKIDNDLYNKQISRE